MLALIGLWAITAPGVFAQDTAKSPTAKSPIVFFGDHKYPPYEYLDDGKPAGANVELIKAIGEALGRPVEIRLMAWSEAQERIGQGEGDALALMTRSKKREELYDFTDATFSNSVVLFVLADNVSGFNIKDLSGKRIAVGKAGLPRYFIEDNHPDAIPVIVKDNMDAFNRLLSKKIDAFAKDEWVGYTVLSNKGLKGIRAVSPPLVQKDFGFAVRKGDAELLQRLNHAIGELKANGTFARIVDKWSGHEIFILTREDLWIVSALVVVAMVLFVAVLSLGFIGRSRNIFGAGGIEGHDVVSPTRAPVPTGLLIMCGSLFAAIFTFDVFLPLGVAGGVPYVAVVLMGWWFPKRNHIIILAGISTALTLIGYFYSPEGGIPWMVVTNRILAFCAIWISAGLLILAKTAMENLRESEKRFKDLYDNAPDMYCSIHAKTAKILQCNDTLATSLGFSKDEIIGRSIFDFYHADSFENANECLRAFADTGMAESDDLKIRRKDGSTFEVSLRVSAVRDENGNIISSRSVWRNITERKRVETALIAAKEEAEHANNAKSEFLSSMSHELRTPLNAILGFTQLLNTDPDHPLTAGQLDATEHVLKAGDHLLSLIDEVLDLVQIESGKVPLDIELQNPAPIMENCATIARHLAEQKGLKFYDRTTGWHLPEIAIDETRFRQVLLNLLSNAVKYNRAGGTVTLSVADGEDGTLRISVADSGRGIAAEKHHLIFAPFSRLGLENSDITGTGIGLTITRELTEAMGGTIGFESALNLGSTFWLEFPIVSGALSVRDPGEEPALAPATSVAATRTADTAPETIHTVLCVEDNPSSLKLLGSIIERIPGTTMISAHTGELGVDLAEIHRPDVIMMDLNLPGMDGVEALKRLRASSATKNIPVIALTARASAKDKNRGLEAGFAEYLTKPINVQEVTAALNQAFQGA